MGNSAIFQGDRVLNLKGKIAARNGAIVGEMDFTNLTANRTYIFPDIASSTVVVSEGTQTLNAAYTFTSAQVFSATSNQITLRTGTNALTINSGSSAAARTYTVPDGGTIANFVIDQGASTLNGTRTFTARSVHEAGIQIGVTGAAYIISFVAAAANRNLTIRDPGASADFVFTEGTQTLDGTYTFSNTIVGDINGNAATVTDGVYTSRTLTAGDGLSGGGDLSADRSFAVDSTVVRTSGAQTIADAKTFDGGATIGSAANLILENGANIINTVTSGVITLAGGNATNDGANYAVFGSTNTGQHRWRSDSTEVGSIDSAGTWTLGPSGVSGGLDHVLYSSNGSSTGRVFNRFTGTLADSQSVLFEVRQGTVGKANIGAFKNASESADNGYIGLRTVTGSFYFLWVDNTGDLRISNSSANIGRALGTVVGTQS